MAASRRNSEQKGAPQKYLTVAEIKKTWDDTVKDMLDRHKILSTEIAHSVAQSKKRVEELTEEAKQNGHAEMANLVINQCQKLIAEITKEYESSGSKAEYITAECDQLIEDAANDYLHRPDIYTQLKEELVNILCRTIQDYLSTISTNADADMEALHAQLEAVVKARPANALVVKFSEIEKSFKDVYAVCDEFYKKISGYSDYAKFLNPFSAKFLQTHTDLRSLLVNKCKIWQQKFAQTNVECTPLTFSITKHLYDIEERIPQALLDIPQDLLKSLEHKMREYNEVLYTGNGKSVFTTQVYLAQKERLRKLETYLCSLELFSKLAKEAPRITHDLEQAKTQVSRLEDEVKQTQRALNDTKKELEGANHELYATRGTLSGVLQDLAFFQERANKPLVLEAELNGTARPRRDVGPLLDQIRGAQTAVERPAVESTINYLVDAVVAADERQAVAETMEKLVTSVVRNSLFAPEPVGKDEIVKAAVQGIVDRAYAAVVAKKPYNTP